MSASYNGGGTGYLGGAGGGATHIATVSGVLSSLSSSTNKSKVLIVAGGGGGAGINATKDYGGNGGGYIGGNGMRDNGTVISNTGATQNGGYSFGLGYNCTSGNCGGGGGGWYGGTNGYINDSGGGGGSGYIGNSLLLSDKGMYQYSAIRGAGTNSCTNSTAATTRTTCTASYGHAQANAANTGNGYAKITRQS